MFEILIALKRTDKEYSGRFTVNTVEEINEVITFYEKFYPEVYEYDIKHI